MVYFSFHNRMKRLSKDVTFCWVEKMEFYTQLTNEWKRFLNKNQCKLWVLLKQSIILICNAFSDTLSYPSKRPRLHIKGLLVPKLPHWKTKENILPKLHTYHIEWNQNLFLLTTNIAMSIIVIYALSNKTILYKSQENLNFNKKTW